MDRVTVLAVLGLPTLLLLVIMMASKVD